jgi:hypothetical protein
MKKLIALIAAILVVPFTAFALTPISDSQMNDVTGQTGVSIAVDVHMQMDIETAAWGDDDGIGGTSQGAWVGASNITGDLFFGLRKDAATAQMTGIANAGADAALATAGFADEAAFNTTVDGLKATINDPTSDPADVATALANLTALEDVFKAIAYRDSLTFTMADAQVLTIDVAQDDTMYNGASFVRIGLGTFELSGDMGMEIELGDGIDVATGDTELLGEELGTLDITGLVVRGAADNYVDITTNGRNSGVTLNLNVLLDQVNMDSLAWGDSDGADHIYTADPTTTDAGYVGVANFDMDMLKIQGLVEIDVASMGDLTSILAEHPINLMGADGNSRELIMWKLANLKADTTGQISDTMVVLTLGNVDGLYSGGINDDLLINIEAVQGDVVLGAASDLTNATDKMGSFYMGNANFTVEGMVAIGAH